MELETITNLLNEHSKKYNFGNLQNIRKDLFSLEKKPSEYPFGKRAIFDHYAFHLGGRSELQFNVGFEDDQFRWGVAISLQPSQSVPNIDVMIPKIERLNEFMRLHSEEYLGDFLMWHFQNNDRSDDRFPQKVPASLIEEGVFIFLGKHSQINDFNSKIILQDFDRLLYLYKFVEDRKITFPNISERDGFHFNPEHIPRNNYNTSATSRQNEIDVSLQHRLLQDLLVEKLQKKPGVEVGSEHENGIGGRIDVIVKKDNGFEFYEIKNGKSARSCIRQALGQLLEYGYWPGSQRPSKLIVVGEPFLDKKAKVYLDTLRQEFSLPIFYKQLNPETASG